MQPFKELPEMDPKAFTGEMLLTMPAGPQTANTIQGIDTKKIFIPDWNNKPKDRDPVISLNGTPILTHQNISAIIANPGGGKSSICEAIAANVLNPEADCLGIAVSEECRGVLYVDFERTELDVWNSFYRMCKRSKHHEGDPISKVTIAGLRSVPRLAERLQTLDYLLQSNECSLLILDGAGDMVTDTNDLQQAIECRIFLRDLTVKYDLSILTTLHPNPGSFKPRGHIGSEIHRECECVLLAKPYENETRMMTSDFEHGKNRNNAPITAGFKWSDEQMMFIACEIDLEAKGSRADMKRLNKAKEIISAILQPPTSLSYTDTINAIMQATNKSKSTAKRLLEDMEGWSLCKKGEDGYYRLTMDN